MRGDTRRRHRDDEEQIDIKDTKLLPKRKKKQPHCFNRGPSIKRIR